MKVRDVGRAILDFELSNIGGFLLLCLSLVMIVFYKVIEVYTKYFLLLVIAALGLFAIVDYQKYFIPDQYGYADGWYVSDTTFIHVSVILTLFGLCTIWPFAKLLYTKLKPMMEKATNAK